MAIPESEVWREDFADPPAVRGFLDRAAAPRGGLVLAHGASSNARAPLLEAAARRLAQAGLTVLRIDLPYRQRRPGGPPSPATAELDREGIRRAAASLGRLIAGRPVFLGGHSYGGRQASMAAAEDKGLSAGLLLCSYPLHPPGQPDRLRTAHLPQLDLPVLFIHGSRDPFGSPEELEAAIRLIPGPTERWIVDGAGHALVEKRQGADRLEAFAAEAARRFCALIGDRLA